MKKNKNGKNHNAMNNGLVHITMDMFSSDRSIPIMVPRSYPANGKFHFTVLLQIYKNLILGKVYNCFDTSLGDTLVVFTLS